MRRRVVARVVAVPAAPARAELEHPQRLAVGGVARVPEVGEGRGELGVVNGLGEGW